MKIAGIVACLLLAACTQARSPGESAEVASQPQPVRTCCPETDSAIYALMAEYERTPAASRPPELAILHHRFTSGIEDRRRLVVRDSATWASLWREITRPGGPPQPVPPVDFRREMLIVATMGTRSSGGYLILIDSVTTGSVAWVRERSPGANCGRVGMLTHPIALARLPRADGPVSFRERAEVRSCP